MKYIRTKDCIYDLEDLKEYNVPFMIVDGYIDFNSGGRYKIIAQADTIEELCDEFRVMYNDDYSTYEIDITCRDLKELYEEMQIQNQTLFGGIWTSKGFIYVAKMNEKGELELL